MAETIAQDQNEEIRRRLAIFFNQNMDLVDRYIELHGAKISMKAIQELRDEVPSLPTSVVLETNEQGVDSGLESPVYPVELECPCCRQKGVLHRELRASAMAVKNDAFLAPAYFPMAKYQSLNYLTVAVAVCPRCLFASPDKKDFIQFNRTTRQNIPSQISMGILSEIQDTLAERQELLDQAKAGKDFSQSPRPYPLAILSYKLADQRAKVESESKTPFSVFKRAHYWTRVALLLRQAQQDDKPALEKALQLFKEAFFQTDFPNANAEFQSCFIIFSLYLRFGMQKEARDYVTVMEQSKKDVEARKDPTALPALNQWLGMAKARWEDKDNPDLWKVPS